MIQDFKIQDFFNSVPNLDFLFKNAWGVFKIRYEFGYFSAIQVYSHGPRLYFFNSVPNSVRFFPFKMHGEFSNSAWIRFHFGSSKICSSSRDFIFSIRCRIRQGFSHLKCMGSFWIRYEFGSFSVNRKRTELLPNLKLLHSFLMGKILPNSAPNWKNKVLV